MSVEIEPADQGDYNLNSDMADVLSPDVKGIKNKRKPQPNSRKASSKTKIEKNSKTVSKKGSQTHTSLDLIKNNQKRQAEGEDNQNFNLNPIRNRELTYESDEDDAEEEEIPTNLGICLIKNSKMLNSSSVSVIKASPEASVTSSDEQSVVESAQYLISRQL